jgi:hypothetical protein
MKEKKSEFKIFHAIKARSGEHRVQVYTLLMMPQLQEEIEFIHILKRNHCIRQNINYSLGFRFESLLG